MPTLRPSTAVSRKRRQATDRREPAKAPRARRLRKARSLRVAEKHLHRQWRVGLATQPEARGLGQAHRIRAARRDQTYRLLPPRQTHAPTVRLEELLSISDEYGITLYERVNARNLQDPDDRYALRIEIAHACRSSDDTSRRLKDQKKERTENGLYNGTRPYGYTKNGMKLDPKEADVVRDIFSRFMNGETPYSIAVDFSRRGVLTAKKHGRKPRYVASYKISM